MTYNTIVLGLGGMGSAAAFELARRGHRVLGLEQFPLAHERGSSHGQTRVIRQAYYEHPAYVPLLRRAYERWFELEQLTGRHLFTPVPCLNAGPPDSEIVVGVRRAAAEHALPVEDLSAAEVMASYPIFHLPSDWRGLLEQNAGVLHVEACVSAHAEAARVFGADLREGERVLSWEPVGSGVRVRTATATYDAAKLVIAAGPWSAKLLSGLNVPLTVMRQVMLWFAPADPAPFRRDRCPIYLLDTPGGFYYGLPMLDPRGHKAARHYGAPELPDVDRLDRSVHVTDEEPVRAFLRQYVPAADGPRRHAAVCPYTLTPDRHFVIDVHPELPQVSVAAGFSGHGFKFASVVGEILADFAEKGRTALPVNLFAAGRFGM